MKEPTNEQLNIAICEWRGWKKGQCYGFCWIANKLLDFYKEYVTGDLETHWKRELPSHILGIEALGNIHEAEKELTEEQNLERIEWLIDEVGIDRKHINVAADANWMARLKELSKLASATARQRAIALSKVVPEIKTALSKLCES